MSRLIEALTRAFYPSGVAPPLFGGGVHTLEGAERAVWVGGLIRQALADASSSRMDGQGDWSQVLVEGGEPVDAVRIVSLMAGHWVAARPGVVRLIAAGSPEFRCAALRAWSPSPCAAVHSRSPLPSVMMRGLDIEGVRGTHPKAQVSVTVGCPRLGCAALESVLEVRARAMCGARIVCIGDITAAEVIESAGLEATEHWWDGLPVVVGG